MDAVIKIDLKALIESGEKVIVELGCGRKKKQGRIGVDKVDLPGVDIVTDMEKGLGFLPDNCVDEIHCRSMLEHIDNFEGLMRDIVRVLKADGRAYVFVPHFSNPYYYSDYTHKRFFGLYTFYYFVAEDKQLKRKVPDFYTDIRIDVISQRLVFRSPFRLSRLLKKPLGCIFNIHQAMQEFYEQHLCYVFPCHGIEVVFAPDKAVGRAG